jgi:hypothetical protein
MFPDDQGNIAGLQHKLKIDKILGMPTITDLLIC